MKVHVVTKNEEHIGGYERVEVANGKLELERFSDNECMHILASDALDELSYENVKKFLASARQKLRMEGSVVVGGVDMRLLARHIINGSISTEDANQTLFNKKSCSDVSLVSDMLAELGLIIMSTRISGIHYEIEASRKSLAN